MRVSYQALGAVLLLSSGLASGAAVVSPAPAVHAPKPNAIQVLRWENATLTQDFLDDLKAGRPRYLMVSLVDSGIEEKAVILRQQRHIRFDDSAVIEMKKEAYAALQRVFLSHYDSSELQVAGRNTDSVPQLGVQIRSLAVLHRLVTDRLVSHIYSPLPIYAASLSGQ